MSDQERINFTRIITQIVWESKYKTKKKFPGNSTNNLSLSISPLIIKRAAEDIREILSNLAQTNPDKSAGEISEMLYHELRS